MLKELEKEKEDKEKEKEDKEKLQVQLTAAQQKIQAFDELQYTHSSDLIKEIYEMKVCQQSKKTSDDDDDEEENVEMSFDDDLPLLLKTFWKFKIVGRYYFFGNLTFIAVNLGEFYIRDKSFGLRFPENINRFELETEDYHTVMNCEQFCFQTGNLYSTLHLFHPNDSDANASRFYRKTERVSIITNTFCEKLDANELSSFSFDKEKYVFKKGNDQILLFMITMNEDNE